MVFVWFHTSTTKIVMLWYFDGKQSRTSSYCNFMVSYQNNQKSNYGIIAQAGPQSRCSLYSLPFPKVGATASTGPFYATCEFPAEGTQKVVRDPLSLTVRLLTRTLFMMLPSNRPYVHRSLQGPTEGHDYEAVSHNLGLSFSCHRLYSVVLLSLDATLVFVGLTTHKAHPTLQRVMRCTQFSRNLVLESLLFSIIYACRGFTSIPNRPRRPDQQTSDVLEMQEFTTQRAVQVSTI